MDTDGSGQQEALAADASGPTLRRYSFAETRQLGVRLFDLFWRGYFSGPHLAAETDRFRDFASTNLPTISACLAGYYHDHGLPYRGPQDLVD